MGGWGSLRLLFPFPYPQVPPTLAHVHFYYLVYFALISFVDIKSGSSRKADSLIDYKVNLTKLQHNRRFLRSLSLPPPSKIARRSECHQLSLASQQIEHSVAYVWKGSIFRRRDGVGG